MHTSDPTEKPEISHNDDEKAEGVTSEHIPHTLAPIQALGIENWKNLEKELVRRLDFTMMPCLWSLYLFNYLDRASIA